MSEEVLKTYDNGGMKASTGKPCIGFLLKSFPNALRAMALTNDHGAQKYDALNWHKLPISEYEDALGRHFLKWCEDPTALDDTGLPHTAAILWNAAAIHELTLRRQEQE